MKRHLLLGLAVGTAATLGIASLLPQDPYSSATASPFMALACGALTGAIYIVARAGWAIGRVDSLPGWSIWRQALLATVSVGVLIYLQGIRSLSWLEAGLILMASFLFELFFRSDKTDARRLTRS